MSMDAGRRSGGASPGGPTVGECEEEDEEASSSIPKETREDNVELYDFRQKWQRELESPIKTADKSVIRDVSGERKKQDSASALIEKCALETDEEEAKSLFLKGADFERNGDLYEAIKYYKRAVQLIPDIEFRIYESSRLKPTSMEESLNPKNITKTEAEGEKTKLPEKIIDNVNILSIIEKRVAKAGCICAPEFNETGTHISSLPIELLMYILRWVVSSDLDMISLERFSQVCCGFYLCARDPEIWKLACVRTWGINCGTFKSQGYQSWRHMFTERPRLRFNGCYISKTSYVRPGENSFQDQYYRPWHLVKYFRYLRFFPDGIVLMMTTSDEPITCLDRLKNRHIKVQGVLSGHYRLSGDKVAISVGTAGLNNQNKQNQSTNTRFKSRRKENPEPPENTFHLELQLKSHHPNMFCSLVWRAYTVFALNKSNHSLTTTTFEIVKSKFPSFKFCQVNRFHAKTENPLL